MFHNPRGWTALVRCVGFNHNGTPVGRIALKIPGNGLRFALASDLANGLDFIGSAACRSTAHVIPSAFVIGPGLTDTKAQIMHGWDVNRYRFPVIASF